MVCDAKTIRVQLRSKAAKSGSVFFALTENTKKIERKRFEKKRKSGGKIIERETRIVDRCFSAENLHNKAGVAAGNSIRMKI